MSLSLGPRTLGLHVGYSMQSWIEGLDIFEGPVHQLAGRQTTGLDFLRVVSRILLK